MVWLYTLVLLKITISLACQSQTVNWCCRGVRSETILQSCDRIQTCACRQYNPTEKSAPAVEFFVVIFTWRASNVIRWLYEAGGYIRQVTLYTCHTVAAIDRFHWWFTTLGHQQRSCTMEQSYWLLNCSRTMNTVVSGTVDCVAFWSWVWCRTDGGW